MSPSCMLVAALALLCTLPAPAHAQDDFEADRPDLSESPRPLPSGRRQLEVGWSHVTHEGLTHDTVGEALIRAGLGSGWELRLALPTWNRLAARAGSIDAGFGDATGGFKLALPGASEAFAAGLIAELTVPSGARDFRGEGAGADVLLAATRALGRAGDATMNVGWQHEDDQDGALVTLSWGADLTARTGGYVEWAMTSAAGAAVHRFDSGLTWRAAHWTQLDARVGLARPEGRTETTFGLGMSQRW